MDNKIKLDVDDHRECLLLSKRLLDLISNEERWYQEEILANELKLIIPYDHEYNYDAGYQDGSEEAYEQGYQDGKDDCDCNKERKFLTPYEQSLISKSK